MRREPEFFGEEELHLIYIAKRLREAKELEDFLTERSLNYLVEPDTYSGGVIFRSQRIGAFFYVRGEDLERTRVAMEEGGYRLFEPEG